MVIGIWHEAAIIYCEIVKIVHATKVGDTLLSTFLLKNLKYSRNQTWMIIGGETR